LATQKRSLEDIAILTGGTVISEDTGRKLENSLLPNAAKPIKFGRITKIAG